MRFNSLTSKLTVLLILCASLLQGCAEPRQGRYHSGTVPHVAKSMQYGTIIRVGEGFIVRDKGFLGSGDLLTMAGGVAAGGLIGSTMGPAAIATGAVASGLRAGTGVIGGAWLAGKSLDNPEEIGDMKAVELTIETDEGELLTLVQENDDYFSENDRVRIVHNADGSARAIH